MKYDSNPDWYRAKHALAREYVSWAKVKEGARAASLLDQAKECAVELLSQAEIKLARPLWGLGKTAAANRKLKNFIADDIVPTTRVLLVEVEAARQSLKAETDVEVTTATVQEIDEETADTPDANYGLARLYAQIDEDELAGRSLQLVIDGTGRPTWPGLAHRIVRDPVLAGIVVSSAFQPVEGFETYLQKALLAAEKPVEKSQGLD